MLVGFGEKRCRKNLPLSVTTLNIHRVLIDATNCPQSVIDRHLNGTGIEYALYHSDSFQLFIADDCSVKSAIDAADAFFHAHVEHLNQLSSDNSQSDDVLPELKLEFLFHHTIPPSGIILPQRLLANLDQTAMPITFAATRFKTGP